MQITVWTPGSTISSPSSRGQYRWKKYKGPKDDTAMMILLLTVVGHQVLMQLVPLILQNLAQIRRNFARYLLHISIELAEVIRQTDQLIQRSDLQIRDVKFIVHRQRMLLGCQIVHSFPCLLTGFISRRGYQPVFRHLDVQCTSRLNF